MVYGLFTSIGNAEFRDFLVSAMASIQMKDWRQAEKLLDRATRLEWANLQPSDMNLLHSLLILIGQNVTFEKFDDQYLEQLGTSIGQGKGLASSLDLSSRAFCPRSAASAVPQQAPEGK